MSEYQLYMLRCRDGSLYTGIAIDVDKRVREHESGTRGARYLRGRGPLELVLRLPAGDRSAASRLENHVKQLSKTDKEALVSGRSSIAELLPQLDGAGSTA